MDLKRFEKLLFIYGCNFEHWDDCDPAEVKTFLKSSEDAQTLYNEAEKLDGLLQTYAVPEANPVLADRILNRAYAKKTADQFGFSDVLDRIITFFQDILSPQYAYGGMTVFAVLLLFFVFSMNVHQSGIQGQNVHVASVVHDPVDIDLFLVHLSDLENRLEEEGDVMAFFDVADAEDAIQAGQDIDIFLDEMLGEDVPDNPEPMDVWDLFSREG